MGEVRHRQARLGRELRAAPAQPLPAARNSPAQVPRPGPAVAVHRPAPSLSYCLPAEGEPPQSRENPLSQGCAGHGTTVRAARPVIAGPWARVTVGAGTTMTFEGTSGPAFAAGERRS